MADAIDFKSIDKRLVQRYVRKGLVDPQQYEEYLKTLPDVAELAEVVEAAFEPTGAPQLGNAAPAESTEADQ